MSRWQSSARDPRTGKAIYRTWPAGTTKREAERNHREWYADISKRRPADRSLTVATYLASWLDVRAGDMSGATHDMHTLRCEVCQILLAIGHCAQYRDRREHTERTQRASGKS